MQGHTICLRKKCNNTILGQNKGWQTINSSRGKTGFQCYAYMVEIVYAFSWSKLINVILTKEEDDGKETGRRR